MKIEAVKGLKTKKLKHTELVVGDTVVILEAGETLEDRLTSSRSIPTYFVVKNRGYDAVGLLLVDINNQSVISMNHCRQDACFIRVDATLTLSY